MKKNTTCLGILLLGLTGLNLSYSAPAVASDETEQFEAGKDFDNLLPDFKEADWTKKRKEAEARAARAPARTEAIEPDPKVSPKLDELRTEFLKISDTKALDAFITRAEDEAEFKKLPVDAKFVAAQLPMLKVFKGVLFRIRPFMEANNAVHSMALSMVRQMVTANRLFLPTTQWTVIEKYITEPQDDMPQVNPKAKGGLVETIRIHDPNELQMFLFNQVYYGLAAVTAKMIAIENEVGEGKFYFDNKFVYGPASFQDNLDRYRKLGKAEIQVTLSNLYASLASLRVTLSYTLTGMLPTMGKVGRIYGVDGFLDGVQGAPAKQRVTVLKENKDIFLLKKNGPENMKRALSMLKASVEYAHDAKIQLKKRGGNEQYVLDATFLKDLDRRAELSYEVQSRMLKGPTYIHSQVTGNAIKVNLPEFYNNPPADLKVFLPTGFQGGSRDLPASVKIAGSQQSVNYRNYHEGEANAWNIPEYKKYFPEVENSDELRNSTALNIAQAYGGFMILGPLSNALF